MEETDKLTEDETVGLLIDYLKLNGWTIVSICLGQSHGNDIYASKKDSRLIIEAKGAKANDNSPTKKRKSFSSGQIKTHFGKALVKVLEERYKNPTAIIGIAHPDDVLIRTSIGNFIPFLKSIGIKHYWVSRNLIIEE